MSLGRCHDKLNPNAVAVELVEFFGDPSLNLVFAVRKAIVDCRRVPIDQTRDALVQSKKISRNTHAHSLPRGMRKPPDSCCKPAERVLMSMRLGKHQPSSVAVYDAVTRNGGLINSALTVRGEKSCQLSTTDFAEREMIRAFGKPEMLSAFTRGFHGRNGPMGLPVVADVEPKPAAGYVSADTGNSRRLESSAA